MQYQNLLPRRTFLLGTATLVASCSRIRNTGASLGTLAYVDIENLWLRNLPDGKPRRVATGHRIAWPRFSPSGRWISFQDGLLGRVVSTIGGPDATVGAQWNTGELGLSPLKWVGNRDEVAVRIANPNTGDPGDTLSVFNAADNWLTPQRSIPLGLNSDAGSGVATSLAGDQFAYARTIRTGRFSDGSGRYRTSLLLDSLRQPGRPRSLAETEGSFDIAGFTASGKWILYWRSEEISASIQSDGLDFFAVNTLDGKTFNPRITGLVDDDMVAISPTGDSAAITSGAGRETWANKAITILDMAGSEISARQITEASVAAQLPAWSPDGARLAWCAGPDADYLYKRRLLDEGHKTITMVGPRLGESRQIAITPGLQLGSDQETSERCRRLRRIYVAEVAGVGGKDAQPRQLTNDPQYADEEPAWSSDGSHILFCRTDTKGNWTIWLMRSDARETRPVTGPLRPPQDLTEMEASSYKMYYGHTDWRSLFDWHRTAIIEEATTNS